MNKKELSNINNSSQYHVFSIHKPFPSLYLLLEPNIVTFNPHQENCIKVNKVQMGQQLSLHLITI